MNKNQIKYLDKTFVNNSKVKLTQNVNEKLEKQIQETNSDHSQTLIDVKNILSQKNADIIIRHQLELEKFNENIKVKPFKESKELLNLRVRQRNMLIQSDYDTAHRLELKITNIRDNELDMHYNDNS